MGRTPLLDVTLRAAALGIAAWLVAGCTWAALDIGGVDRQLPALAPAAAVRASSLSRGAVRVGDFALPTPGGPAGADGIRLTLVDGGRPAELRVQPGTVLDLLRASIYGLGPLDRVEGSLDAALVPGMIVQVTRGAERVETIDEAVIAPTTYQNDAGLNIGDSRVVSTGHAGTVERTYRVRTEDGVVVERQLLNEVVLDAAVAPRIAIGTRPLTLETPYGPVSYTRALNVVATYYTPANGGKAPDSPLYGITATGARATRGIIAVDPRVIPMYSWVYVPGYGIAQARDVGSAIIGDHIDVAFDDGDGAWWGRRYLTVYVLAR